MRYTVIRVGRDDSAKSLSQKYKTTERSLFLLNGNVSFFEGERIIAQIFDCRQYTVMPFDTINSVADKFDVTPAAIKLANGIPDRIFLGQSLLIPNEKK